MPRPFGPRLFDRWLAQNRSRFRHAPTAVVRRKRWRTFGFTGVDPSIWGSIGADGQIVIGVDYRGQTWDFLAGFDIAPQRQRAGGYACQMCVPEARTIYADRAALWIEHSFEPLLEWCNARFQAGANVVLSGSDGATWARLESRAVEPPDGARSNMVAIYPLLNSQRPTPAAAAAETIRRAEP
ncbi:MAG TPA: hypothetical protein PKY50_18695 [Candidatus Competibacter sp.]|nr:hypothetical protein [Candidatus Competibacter sp.]